MTGCTSTDYQTPDAGTSGLKRIAVIHIAQETNSFSTVLTTLAEFESSGLYYGDEIFPALGGGKNAVAGAMAAAAELGEGRVELVPILSANAMSG
ncbi:MAG TPA: hypothetical protein DCO79_13815, partial [Spirochaeta sp.]|nr:hypothetical protein [Spirochaeta sp.]